jgi:hypothetical protein
VEFEVDFIVVINMVLCAAAIAAICHRVIVGSL